MRVIDRRTKLLCTLLVVAMPFGSFAQTAAPEFNITTDSAAGWVPNADLQQQALAAMTAYFAAVESGRYRDAYAAMAPINRESVPFDDFEQRAKTFRTAAGDLIQRRVLKVTWTKDPSAAPLPGVYVAIDLSARYAKVSRQCGYIVLYQAPSGGPFQVMRTEDTHMSDADAAKLDPKERDRTWGRIAATYCPNYKPEPTVAMLPRRSSISRTTRT